MRWFFCFLSLSFLFTGVFSHSEELEESSEFSDQVFYNETPYKIAVRRNLLRSHFELDEVIKPGECKRIPSQDIPKANIYVVEIGYQTFWYRAFKEVDVSENNHHSVYMLRQSSAKKIFNVISKEEVDPICE